MLLDIRELDHQEALTRLRASSRAATIVVAREIDDDRALDYLEAGGLGAIDPGATDQTTLRRILLGALRGEPVFPRRVLGLWLKRLRRGIGTHGQRQLTARQREVMELVAGGATDREIAKALDIRVATAQKHVANVLRRLGATNRAAAVSVALMTSLIQPARRIRRGSSPQ